MAVTWKKVAYEADVITKALLTAHGDIIYASGVATPAILAHGEEGDVLTVASSLPSWVAPGAPGAHAATHQNTGGDEISVADLSGVLADDQHVIDAEVTTVIEATPLNDLAAADGAVDCGGQQMTDMVLQNSETPPATAVVGKIYFDTDLSAYICTDSTP